MARKILCAYMVLFVSISAYAINNSSPWVEAISGSSLSSVERTFDGGYVALGTKYQNGFSNVLLVRLSSAGELEWARTYRDDKDYVYASTILQVADGGFLFTGVKNARDTFLVKVDSAGNILWQRTYSVRGRLESFPQLIQAADGGFFLAGTIRTTYKLRTYDGWFMKLNSDGAIVWQKLYGRSNNYESISAASAASDGDFMIAGRSGHLAMTAKIKPTGNVRWQKVYAVSGYHDAEALAISTTKDGGYIVGGQCGQTVRFGTGWIAKLGSQGNPMWESTVRSHTDFRTPISDTTGVTSLRQEKDGHILAMGKAGQAMGCTMAGCVYMYDIWSARLDSAGNVFWQNIFDGATVYAIHGTPDDGTVFVGSNLIGRISSDGGVCTELTRPGDVTSKAVSITTTPADLLIRNGKFVQSTARFVQDPVKLKMKNLCDTNRK